MHQLPAAWTLRLTMCLHSTMPTMPETSSHPAPPLQLSASAAIGTAPSSTVVSHVAQTGSKSRQALLMTCRVLFSHPMDTPSRKEPYWTLRRLLHSSRSDWHSTCTCFALVVWPKSLASVVSPTSHSSQSVVHLGVAPAWSVGRVHEVEAIVLPKVTSDLPLHPVPFAGGWQHLWGLQLADPEVGNPGGIDILLGVDIFSDVLLHGRRSGPRGSPTAIETHFGWVLAGAVDCSQPPTQVVAHHTSILSGDDLRKFWEIEELSTGSPVLSPEEQSVLTHFLGSHHRDKDGRFTLPLPRRPDAKPLGESRSLTVRRFLSLERSLRAKDQFQEFRSVIEEYFEMDHANLFPLQISIGLVRKSSTSRCTRW